MPIAFRPAAPEDCGIIHRFILALAEYEELAHQVVITQEDIFRTLFEERHAFVILAEEDGVPVGQVLYFFNYSTFTGRKGLYIEDLFVLPEHRGKGYGKALLREAAARAVREGCARIEWICLDSNRSAWEFYEAMGAHAMEEWTLFRLAGDRLAEFSAGK